MSVAELHLTSRALSANTHVQVILPEPPMEGVRAFYESGRKYKVLWLLHGGTGNAFDWVRKSMIDVYAEERDLVVVMPDGYNSYYTNWPEYRLNMETYFFEELMPMVYNWLPVSRAREDNFIAGLSMGALGTAKFVAMRPELFAGAAMFSATPIDLRAEPTGRRDRNLVNQAILAHGSLGKALESSDNDWDLLLRNRDRLPLMYFSCGTEDEHYPELYVKFKKYAQDNDLPFLFSETPGFRHEWRFWDQEIEKALKLFGLEPVYRF